MPFAGCSTAAGNAGSSRNDRNHAVSCRSPIRAFDCNVTKVEGCSMTEVTEQGNGRRATRALALSTTLAILLVLISTTAGVAGASAWRASIRDQAKQEFVRQSAAVGSEFRERLHRLDGLFALMEQTDRERKPFGPALTKADLIKSYPGVLSAGHLVGTPTAPHIKD